MARFQPNHANWPLAKGKDTPIWAYFIEKIILSNTLCFDILLRLNYMIYDLSISPQQSYKKSKILGLDSLHEICVIAHASS